MMEATFGPAYESAHDGERISKQLDRIRDFMLRSDWITLDEITAATGDPPSSISAQLRHLRKPRFGGFIVDKRRRGDPGNGLWEYRVSAPVGWGNVP